MERAVQSFADRILALRAGVVSPALIETIRVDYQGQKRPIRELGQVSQSQGIVVRPYDPAVCGAIQKTLEDAGHSCYVCKGVVVVTVPKFATSADRERAVARIRTLEEETKVVLRNLRKKARHQLTGSEDEIRKGEKELQALTDEQVGRVTALANNKVQAL
jgi:ribosome recycling factor